jgi:hypothetical protein
MAIWADVCPRLAEHRRLEAEIAPQRAASTTITVNRHAQFRPHTDSGAGAGQSSSLIVAVGARPASAKLPLPNRPAARATLTTALRARPRRALAEALGGWRA